MYYIIHTDQLRIVKKVYHWYIFRPKNNLIIFNLFLGYLIFRYYLSCVNNDKQKQKHKQNATLKQLSFDLAISSIRYYFIEYG